MTRTLSVLIVEDEPIIALSLACAVEAAGAQVVGPASSTVEALGLLAQATIDAAIIDVQLEDRDITPVAVALLHRHVPFVVHTGTGLPDALALSHPDLPVLMKPICADAVMARLMQQMPVGG
ncbi:response regulator [Sphingomonadaceae bacterium G21617-S1]|jgi:CheY-like chemotaxis protein|uniref:response regulator n=1 Tax=Rhizorhabdus sp. TaxID=1968843 RepID=UPI0019897189|nr:response regulator [Rhizorhabdus sp.]MBD3760875.1 response regulator [Rhizorhabdus sp.]MCZ4343373.1 response regulator [Sphingomonadaceae bacterium G21617-S1]